MRLAQPKARAAQRLLVIGLLVGCDNTQTGGAPERASQAPNQSVEELAGRLSAVEERLARLEAQGVPRERGIASQGEGAPGPEEASIAAEALGVSQQSGQVGQSVKFSSYSEGRVFPRYGMPNMIVQTSAGLALTSASGTPATLEFADFDIRERIDVLVQIRTGYWTDQQVILLEDDAEIISIRMTNYDLRFGDHVKKRSRTGWKRGEQKNELRVTIAENRARLFVNGRFFGVQEVAFSRANRLRITGIKRDKDFIYAVSIRPLA